MVWQESSEDNFFFFHYAFLPGVSQTNEKAVRGSKQHTHIKNTSLSLKCFEGFVNGLNQAWNTRSYSDKPVLIFRLGAVLRIKRGHLLRDYSHHELIIKCGEKNNINWQQKTTNTSVYNVIMASWLHMQFWSNKQHDTEQINNFVVYQMSFCHLFRCFIMRKAWHLKLILTAWMSVFDSLLKSNKNNLFS